MSHPSDPKSIVSRFVAEEANPHILALVEAAIAEASQNRAVEIRRFEFNLFDLELNFGTAEALISEVIAPNEQASVPIQELHAAIQERLAHAGSA